jgi:hypothetical protein
MKSSKSIDELAVAIPENLQSRQISQGTNFKPTAGFLLFRHKQIEEPSMNRL